MLSDTIKDKVSLVDEFERHGHALRKAGGQLVTLCPFHEERTPSCHVRPDKGVFHCFGCGASGTVIDFHALKRGITAAESIGELGRRLGLSERVSQVTTYTGGISKPSPLSTHSDRTSQTLPCPMSDADNARALEMAVTLRGDPALCERIAKSRGWRPETVCELAWEPSLGWHEGKLAFLYESGVKLRWRENGERVIRWAFGKPWLWRGGYLWDSSRPDVYLTEGETDAISLVDAGIESDGKTLVVAMPSASTFNESWTQLFKGKDIILALDGDKAGQEATTRISGLLQPFAKSLRRINWEGLQQRAS